MFAEVDERDRKALCRYKAAGIGAGLYRESDGYVVGEKSIEYRLTPEAMRQFGAKAGDHESGRPRGGRQHAGLPPCRVAASAIRSPALRSYAVHVDDRKVVRAGRGPRPMSKAGSPRALPQSEPRSPL